MKYVGPTFALYVNLLCQVLLVNTQKTLFFDTLL